MKSFAIVGKSALLFNMYLFKCFLLFQRCYPTKNYLLLKTFQMFFIFLLLSFASISNGVTIDRVIAIVGDEVITFADYQSFVKAIGTINPGDEVDEKLLKNLVEEKIILQEAKRKGLVVSDSQVDRELEDFKDQFGLAQKDFESFLHGEGFTIIEYRKRIKDKIMVSNLVGDEVDSKIIIGGKEIQDYYQTNIQEFQTSPERVELKAIFLQLKEDISVTELTDLKLRTLKIVAELKEGDYFDLLVDKYSDEPLRSQGGILGNFTKGTLLPQLDKKAFSMEEGEISDPIWVSEGAYILKLTKKRRESYKAFEDVKEDIFNSLYMKKRDKLYNEWIKALWERTSISIKQG